jgi:hypothetical protein
MVGGIDYGFNVKRPESVSKASEKVVQDKRQEDAGKRSNFRKQSIVLCFLVLVIFLLGMFIGYNNGVSYTTHHLLIRDKLNHILPEVRASFLETDFANICPYNTNFMFVECSTNFGLYSSDDLCFICHDIGVIK